MITTRYHILKAMYPTDPNSDAFKPSSRQLATVGAPAGTPLPTLFQRVHDRGKRFWEFFTVNIRNRNTRRAYFIAVSQFAAWCEGRALALDKIEPMHVAAYIELLMQNHSKPTVKQHLAAIRMLFDWLVTGQIMPTNPAHSVRGPRHSVKKGKTPVLSADETRVLLDRIPIERTDKKTVPVRRRVWSGRT